MSYLRIVFSITYCVFFFFFFLSFFLFFFFFLRERESKINAQKVETVTSFKYLGSVITDEGSKPKIQDITENSSIDKVETSLE